MNTKTVIVAEDNKDLLELFGYGLRSFGWKVVLTRGSHEFWERLKEIRPSVILLDINLVGGSGLNIVRRLKDDPAYHDIPIAAMSGFSSRRAADPCFEAGCSAILLKPFQFADLQKVLMDLVATAPQPMGTGEDIFTKPTTHALQARPLHS